MAKKDDTHQGRPDPASEAFDRLIDGFAAVACGQDEDGFLRKTLEEAMEGMAKEGIDIRKSMHRIWDGDRDEASLTKGLSEIELIPVKGTLEMIQGLSAAELIENLPPGLRDAILSGDEERFAAALDAIPEEEQAAIFELMVDAGLLGEPDIPLDGPAYHDMVEPLLIAIAEVANGAGNAELKTQIEEELDFLAQCGQDITSPVQRIWAGERDSTALTAGLDDDRKVTIERILALIAES